jgi:hypothetical protein
MAYGALRTGFNCSQKRKCMQQSSWQRCASPWLILAIVRASPERYLTMRDVRVVACDGGVEWWKFASPDFAWLDRRDHQFGQRGNLGKTSWRACASLPPVLEGTFHHQCHLDSIQKRLRIVAEFWLRRWRARMCVRSSHHGHNLHRAFQSRLSASSACLTVANHKQWVCHKKGRNNYMCQSHSADRTFLATFYSAVPATVHAARLKKRVVCAQKVALISVGEIEI